MAKVSICDLCKRPVAEIVFRLSVFKRVGKQHTNKAEAEICDECHKMICEVILSPVDSPKFISLGRPDSFAQIQAKALNSLPSTILTEKPKEVSDGVFRVPSNSPGTVKKLGSRKAGVQEEAKTEAGQCKHNNKTMEDDTMRVVCKDCGRPVED